MPWEAKDAKRHTKKINSQADAEEWASIANGVLRDTGDEGLAIAKASGHVRDKRHKRKKK